MKRITKILLIVITLASTSLGLKAQLPYRQYADNGILLNFHEIDNVDFRVYLLHSLSLESQFLLTANEEPGLFSISADDENVATNLGELFEDFYQNAYADFRLLTKEDIHQRFPDWKNCIAPSYFISMMMDVSLRAGRPSNNHCVDSDPFCTSDVITFDAAATSQTADQLEGTTLQDGCIGSSYNPSWYHMRIQTGGQFIIHMEGHDPNTPSTTRDVDFCMWGPYTDPVSPCVAQLTTNMIIDCSFSASYTENIYLGYQGDLHNHGSANHGTIYYHEPQPGEYYILMITNYSQQPCTISFTKTEGSGPGTTDCGILPGVVNNDGPYCVGETIHLTVNQQNGATYSWTGPNGFSSTSQNPIRPNCTMAMAGTYTCVTTVGNQTTSATTEVVIYPQPTANFNFTSVCVGNATQFTSTSTTNPSGQNISSYQWNFGDGQTGSGQSTTHTYAAPGTYQASLTVQTSGSCTHSVTKTVNVYAQPSASATALPSTVIYGGNSSLSGNAGAQGTFNFHWEPANMVTNPNSQTTQTVALQQSQTFTLTVTNPQGGCSSTTQVTVSLEGSSLTATATAEPAELCEGGTTTLHALPAAGTGNYTYNWTPANTLSDPNSQNPEATPGLGTTTYTCHISDGFTNIDVPVTIQVYPLEEEHQYESICANDTYNFYGDDFSTPNTYEHHELTDHGCDKTIYLHLDNWPVYDETTITEYICHGESYEFYGNTYTQSIQTAHTDHTTQHGCDSIVRLNLTVYPANDTILSDPSICVGQSYNFHGTSYNQDGQIAYFDTIDNHGCLLVEKLMLTVGDYQMPPVEYHYVCYPHDEEPSWTWDKNGVTYHANTTDEVILPDPAGNCDFKHRLNLKFHKQFYHEESVEVCDTYTWPINGMTYTESQNGIEKTFQHSFGNTQCDSTYVLNLQINHFQTNSISVNTCDFFFWDAEGHTITETDHTGSYYTLPSQPNDLYERTYLDINGCDSIVSLDLDLEYTPRPTPIYPIDNNNTAPHWVVTATEFQINAYEFNLWDSFHPAEHHWDSVKWQFVKEMDGQWVEDSSLQWILAPDSTTTPVGMQCKMYVLNYVADTVWLQATAYNKCSLDGVSRLYWFVSSFYGVEEQGHNPADFTVVPNPNNGQMTLHFEHFSGDINIKVYDMRGALIDQFETVANAVANTQTYQMRNCDAGIYFIVATGKEGIKAKKVVIQH